VTRRPGAGPPRRAALIPALPRPAWVVLGGDFVSAIGSGLTLPCLFIYAHQVRQLSYGTAGLVVAIIALASLAGNPLGGAMADRWTPRRALMAGLIVAAAGSVALAAARSAAALFGAAGLLGLGVAVIWPAQDALLASVAGPAGRSAVFSVRHASMNAGLGLGALCAAALVSVAHPGTFTAVYLADAASFLAFVPVLARLRLPVAGVSEPGPGQRPPPPGGFGQVLRDRAFLRVWALTALIVTITFGQFQSSFAGYATRPGGIGTHGLGLAFAANTLTVVALQLFVLRRLAGHRRTTGVALAATAWAACWAVVIVGGRLGGSAAAEVAFVTAMVIFALGETLLSPTLPAIINDLAPPEAAGRYNGLGTLAFTTGFLLGPIGGAAALGAGRGSGLFTVMLLACLIAAVAALRLGRHLPTGANQIPRPDAATTRPVPAESPVPSAAAGQGGRPGDAEEPRSHQQPVSA
jgi:MFS family permease